MPPTALSPVMQAREMRQQQGHRRLTFCLAPLGWGWQDFNDGRYAAESPAV